MSILHCLFPLNGQKTAPQINQSTSKTKVSPRGSQSQSQSQLERERERESVH